MSNVLFFSAMPAAILSPSLRVFTLAGVVTGLLGDYECFSMRRSFEGGHYFASLFAKCGVNSSAATKVGAVSI